MIVPSGSIRNATIIPGSFVSITTPCSSSRLSRWNGSTEMDSSARSRDRRIWSLARLAFRSLYAGAQSRLMGTSVVLSQCFADLDIEPDRPDVRLELLRSHPGEVLGTRPPPAQSRLPPEIGREAPVPSRNREPDRAQLGQWTGLPAQALPVPHRSFTGACLRPCRDSGRPPIFNRAEATGAGLRGPADVRNSADA